MPLCYAILYYAMLYLLCYALQGVVSELSFLAKPCQPNRYEDYMALVDPLEGYELDTPTTHGHP